MPRCPTTGSFTEKRVFNPQSITLPAAGGGLFSMNPRQAVVECETAQRGKGKSAYASLKEEDSASFGDLVFGNRRDENIVAACVKAHGEFVVKAVVLALNLVAQEGHLEGFSCPERYLLVCFSSGSWVRGDRP